MALSTLKGKEIGQGAAKVSGFNRRISVKGNVVEYSAENFPAVTGQTGGSSGNGAIVYGRISMGWGYVFGLCPVCHCIYKKINK